MADAKTNTLPQSKYKLEKDQILGKGAYGTVYLATDDKQNQVAIKILKSQDGFGIDGRILVETSVLGSLKHDNIVRLIEPLFDEGDMWLVMELMSKTLGEFLREHPRGIELSQAKMTFKAILAGLEHIHAASVVHRNLTIDNVMINTNKEKEVIDEVKIASFGQSITVYHGWETQGFETASLSELFMSPELILDPGFGHSTVDIWAAGCIFVMLIFGEEPEVLNHALFSDLSGDLRYRDMKWFCESIQHPPEAHWEKAKGILGLLWELYNRVGERGYMLLGRIFDMDWEARISASDALDHDFFSD